MGSLIREAIWGLGLACLSLIGSDKLPTLYSYQCATSRCLYHPHSCSPSSRNGRILLDKFMSCYLCLFVLAWDKQRRIAHCGGAYSMGLSLRRPAPTCRIGSCLFAACQADRLYNHRSRYRLRACMSRVRSDVGVCFYASFHFHMPNQHSTSLNSSPCPSLQSS